MPFPQCRRGWVSGAQNSMKVEVACVETKAANIWERVGKQTCRPQHTEKAPVGLASSHNHLSGPSPHIPQVLTWE